MLTRLKFSNFKSWRHADLRFGRVTGLFGPNSSGKSSLLQFLLMLKQTKNATDRGLVLDLGGPDQLVNLGTFHDMVHGHDENATIDWRLEWEELEALEIPDPAGRRRDVMLSGHDVAIECEVALRRNSMSARRLMYEFEYEKYTLTPKPTKPTEFDLSSSSSQGSGYDFQRTRGRAWPLPGPIKTHLFPDQAKTYYRNADFLGYYEVSYEETIDDIYYLGPLREYPKRLYTWSGGKPVDVGPRGERTVDAILAATSNGNLLNLGRRTKRRSFQEVIAYWLQELGLIQEFRVEELVSGSNTYRAIAQRDRRGSWALLTDVGFGVSQVLPVLVLLYYVPEGATVILEQPEIHLHPAVQSGLADVMLKVAETRNVQVIVESHSEHILRRLQRRVAENSTQVDDVRLYFCDLKRGISTLSDLQLNTYGEIKNWPSYFFGDDLGEIAAIQKSGLRRRMEEA